MVSVQNSLDIHRDHLGSPCQCPKDMFEATLRGPDHSICPINIMDCGDGRHMFQFKVVGEGKHVVEVTCRGVPISDSPVVINAKHGIEYGTRATNGVPLLLFGKEGTGPGDLCRPWGVCCDNQVCERRSYIL